MDEGFALMHWLTQVGLLVLLAFIGLVVDQGLARVASAIRNKR